MRYETDKKNILQSERGIALITAILACALLLALALLVISISTKDLRTSTQTVAGKHSQTAAENAVYIAIQNFDPDDLASFTMDGTTSTGGKWNVNVVIPPGGLATLPVVLVGHSGEWSMDVYNAEVTGRTSRYGGNTETELIVGIGVLGPGASTTYNPS